uniref:Predicted protein n=1 Tax=Physcomitrium patens TaxID=3218 RepID=A9U7X8_PHYPA
MPKTSEQLYQVLRAFKLKDPNGNGLQDEIPLSGAMNSWHTETPITFMCMTALSEWLPSSRNGGKGLRYIHKLFRGGLIDPEVFTQSLDGLVETASRKDNVLGAVTTGFARMVFDSNTGIRSRNYEAVPPLIGPSGYQTAGYFSSFDRAAFAVTDKATAAEAAAALRLADFLMTEEATILNEWGPKNKWWRKGRPGEYDEHGRPAKYWLDPEFSSSSAQNDVWAQMGLLYRDRDLRESWAVTESPGSFVDYEHRLYEETLRKYAGKEPDEVYPDYIFMDTSAAEEAARLKVPIDEYIQTNLVQFITGVKDTVADWDDYVAGLKQLKLDRYMEIHQNAYDAYKQK